LFAGFGSSQVASIYATGDSYQVILRFDPNSNWTVDALDNVRVRTVGDKLVPLSAIAHIERTAGPLSVNQVGQLAAVTRPILVVNMTLNKIGRASLAGLYRKAESFTASSLHTGSSSLGYRSSNEYGSDHARGHRGISLGTAMTISGAAASPNMGTFSSPMLTFLLTLFNARLGAWLGNPAAAGTSWRRGERSTASLPSSPKCSAAQPTTARRYAV
jgi:hypothetical protein